MNEANVDECDSVDLTEDENSSGGNSEDENRFDFPNCSGKLNNLIWTVSEADIPVKQLKGAAISSFSECPKEATTLKNTSMKPHSNKFNSLVNKKVGQYTSIQIKPPTSSVLDITNSVPDTQDIPEGDTLQSIETVTLESDNESESVDDVTTPQPRQHNLNVPKQTSRIKLSKCNSIYSQQQPPGKVVIIKKNNKYYKIIIPHNVMPNITQSVGSVLINIPEVGPLVINNDPQATKAKRTQLRQQQLSLNLDAVEQSPDSTMVMRKKQDFTKTTEQVQDSMKIMKPPTDTHLQVLKDKKFCWTFNSQRKRDLEGFTVSDRLGFHKSQAVRAKKCEKAVMSVIRKLENRLANKECEFEKFRMSLLKRDEVKLVKINTILEKGLSSEKFVPNSELEEADDYGSDLLVTKKVVILNEKNIVGKRSIFKGSGVNKVIGRRRKRKGKGLTKKARRAKEVKKPKNNFDIRPCSVHIVRDRLVEEAYMKYCQDMGLKLKRNPVISLKSKEQLFDLSCETKLNSDNTNIKDSPTVSAKQDVKQTKTFESPKSMLMSKVIKSRQKLINEINNHKPFLILTDQTVGYNRSLEYYFDQFGKSNIIYVVNSNKVLKNSVVKAKDFVSAVEIGYIKLVDSDLFCKFVANGMKFSGTRNSSCRNDHNYALLQRYNFGLKSVE